MKDIALEIVASRPAAVGGVNALREYLQSRILGALQDAAAMGPLAFMGGTALRFLYRIPRYSEDMDFTLEFGQDTFDFRDLVGSLIRTLEREGYALKAKVNDKNVVDKTFIGFSGLLAEAGLSPHADQVLWVKVDVDTNPPHGATLAVTALDRFGPLRVQHHDLSSLFAGKLAAVLAREYTKGRDLYDLMWYLMREPTLEPNVELLSNALIQTLPEAASKVAREWPPLVRARLADVDWDDARRDVAPFLENRRDLELVAPETFAGLLATRD